MFCSSTANFSSNFMFFQALQGGHAILLGTSYSTGRATLVRLAAYVAHCKVGVSVNLFK